MEITRENTGELTATIKIVISPADYNESVTKILKDYQRKANVPGFRPGHVPYGMIKKLYGGSVFAEQVNKLLSDKLNQYITDEKLDLLGRPLPNSELTPEFEWKEGQEIEFFFDLGLSPEFNLVLDENIAIEYNVITADDSMIDNYLSEMQQRFGTLINQEIADEKSVLFGEFVQLDADGNDLENGIVHSAKLPVDLITDSEVKSRLVGAKISDVIYLNLLDATGNIDETAKLLGTTKTAVDQLESQDFSFTVNEISVMVPAELNEALFEQVFPEMGVVTEEDFRKQVRIESEKTFVSNSDHLFTHHLQEKLVETVNISLPDEFMKRWLVEGNEGKITAEDIERDYHKYADGMTWQLIENKIIREAGIEVSDQEIKDSVKDYYLSGWRTMPVTGELMERLEAIADSFIKKQPDEVRRIVDSIYQQRITAYVKSKVKLIEKEISYNEFVKLDAEKH